MKKVLLLAGIFFAYQLNAQDYMLGFAGTGASDTVSSVKIENLTTGTSLIISGGDILHLTLLTGIHTVKNSQSLPLTIYPNPLTSCSTLEIFPPDPGDALITVHEITGKLVYQNYAYLENSRQEFLISGISSGLYLVSISGKTYQYSEKLFCTGNSNGKICIEKVNNTILSAGSKKSGMNNNGTQGIVDMEYKTGDRLKFTALSGNFSSVIIDKPLKDKTITFNFAACTDGDNNNYPVVKIGNQFWMAENLKTTRYRNGNLIGTTTPATLDITTKSTPKYQWAYDGIESYVDTYGRLYTWYAVTDSRNVCPPGWHIPSADEYASLNKYLINNAYGFEGSGSDIAKSMASTVGWAVTYPTPGFPGNDPASNNSSGFSALPEGDRRFYEFTFFSSMGYYGYGWSSTAFNTDNAWYRGILIDSGDTRMDKGSKKNGFSARCLKD